MVLLRRPGFDIERSAFMREAKYTWFGRIPNETEGKSDLSAHAFKIRSLSQVRVCGKGDAASFTKLLLNGLSLLIAEHVCRCLETAILVPRFIAKYGSE